MIPGAARLCLSAALLSAAIPAGAQQSPDFPRRESFIIQLSASQYDSGLAVYLVSPLQKAFRKTGMRYEGRPAAHYAATVETGADTGKWYGEGDAAKWLYERFVTVGLSPAEAEGQGTADFAVTAVLVTPNEDRVDELNCLIALATRELAARYRPEGHVRVDGRGCARR